MIKELRNEENLVQKGSKFIYSQIREVEMDFSDVNAVATRSKHEIDELNKTIKGQKKEIVRKRLFMAKNSKPFREAVKQAEKQFCQKCGLDFAQNKNERSSKTTKVYEVLCKKCAKKESD